MLPQWQHATIMKKIVKFEKEICQKGNCEVNVILNGDRNDNKFSKNMEKYEEKFNKLKEDLYYYKDLILGYLELYTVMKAKSEYKLIIKYSNKLKNEDLEKKIVSEYSKCLEKYKKLDDKLFKEFSFSLTKEENDKIKEVLENWKKNIKEEGEDMLNEAINFICEEGESVK